ncbi:MAG: c-type cytochrome [Chitinophagaceae bacterium]|nr:c-type cytochrome [Chitinophagaceae bacterium]MCB9044536.1 c-type cytochrome [Chitinophagales bacterium]
MKNIVYVVLLALPVALIGCAGSNKEKQPYDKDLEAQVSKIHRGEYLVTIAGCGDCHTPKVMTAQGPQPDMERYLSGYNANNPLGEYDTTLAQSGRWALFSGEMTAAAGPWGVSFAANLTPDGTGLGNWSLENFRTALRKGKYKGIESSRPLLPPMPWQNYAQFSDQDIEAIFEYLKSIKPVENLVPQAIAPKM